MDDPNFRLVFYAAAVSAACVEVFGSVEAGIWHSALYWASIAGIIPFGLLGIRQIYLTTSEPGRADARK